MQGFRFALVVELLPILLARTRNFRIGLEGGASVTASALMIVRSNLLPTPSPNPPTWGNKHLFGGDLGRAP